MTLQPFAIYSGGDVSVSVLIALLVCLIPTTIGGLLSAIGIAGMDRLVQHNVLAMSGRAVEAAGDVDTLLLDKTGTITFGNRQASEFLPVAGVTEAELADAAQLASLSDETPEGRSIVVLAKQFGIRERDLDEATTDVHPVHRADAHERRRHRRRADPQGRGRRGRGLGRDPRRDGPERPRGAGPQRLRERAARRSSSRAAAQVLGVIHLKDIVKGGIRERFEQLRAMGIRTVMITGDNPVTAAVIAKEAGVDDFLAQATPETKMELIRKEQASGKLVAMTGDGTNDAPALAQADVGVAMNTGTSAAKEAGNMVDLDSDPTKLIEIVEIGKQLLMTRGALTTFSIANDVAKYFAIIPAMFMVSLSGARPAQHHGAALAAERDHERGHLQRAHHRRAHPARAARREVPAGRRGRAAAPQPARLRPRRHHRAVHRHQGHRCRPRRPAPRLGDRHETRALVSLRMVVVTIVLTGVVYPSLSGASAPSCSPSRRPAASSRTLAAASSARGSSPSRSPPTSTSTRGPRPRATATTRCRRAPATSGRRAGARLGGREPRRRAVERGPAPRRARSGRHGHLLGQRARPGHHARQRVRCRSRASPRRAGCRETRCASWSTHTPGRAARGSRRAAGQRARAEPGARRASLQVGA